MSREERLDFGACAVLACAVGCDALYEAGLFAVGEDGTIVVARTMPGPLADRLATLDGLTCPAYDEARAVHFRRHRLARFRPTVRPEDPARHVQRGGRGADVPGAVLA